MVAVGDPESHVQDVRFEAAPVELAQDRHLVVVENGALEQELHRRLGPSLEQVGLGAEAGAKAHHDVLAHGVDGRVGDLREALLEVAEERRRLLGEHREREVVAHRAGRLLGVARHRREQDAEVFLGEAERQLASSQLVGLRRRRRGAARLGQVLQADGAGFVPLAPRRRVGDDALGLALVEHAALLEVDREHRAGAKAPAVGDVLVGHLERAGLRRNGDPPVVGDDPAPGAQAVAVERRAQELAVGEGDRGRAVPRLDQARVVVEEALELGRDAVAVLVSARDHHHHRVGQGVAREAEELEHVVEGERVRGARRDEGEAAAQVVAEELRVQDRLARLHPVDVPLEGVDLAVVGGHAVGVGETPAREGVGGEARVDDRERRLHQRVAKVGVEVRELRRGEHALVDDRARREAGEGDLGGLELERPADQEELALEGVGVRRVGAAADHELADRRHHLAGDAAAVGRVRRDLSRAEGDLAFGADHLLDAVAELQAALRVGGQEAHGHRHLAGAGHVVGLDAELGGARAEELVGELDQDARAVAGVRVRSRGSAVLEQVQGRDAALDHLVDRLAVEARKARDATPIVLVGRVVETSGPGRRKVRTRLGRAAVHAEILDQLGLSYGNTGILRAKWLELTNQSRSPHRPRRCGPWSWIRITWGTG